MAYIGNTPSKATVISIEARKSFSLALWFRDTNRRPADLTGCQIRLVVKALPLNGTDDSDNLVTGSTAFIDQPKLGYARFALQAQELNLQPAEYPFAIVLVTAAGYSSVVVKGVLDVQQNTEFASMGSQYDGVQPPSALEVLLRGSAAVDVYAGSVVPPGFTWMSDDDKAKLDRIDEASLLLPDGGAPGEWLRKRTPADYDFEWAQPQAFDGTLSAEGIPAGYAPVSEGDGAWTWAMVSPTVNWDLPEGEPGSVLNKPSLGTAAAKDVDYFAEAEHEHDGSDVTSGTVAAARLPRISELRGVARGTDVPTTGTDGDWFLRVLGG